MLLWWIMWWLELIEEGVVFLEYVCMILVMVDEVEE